MDKRIWCFCILLHLATAQLFAQRDHPDSIRMRIDRAENDTLKVKQMQELTIYYIMNGKSDSALTVAENTIAFSRKIGYPRGEFTSLWMKVDATVRTDKVLARKLLLQTHQDAMKLGDSTIIAKSFNQYGYQYMFYYPELKDSCEYLFNQSLKWNNNQDDQESMFSYRFLAALLHSYGKSEEALNYIESSLKIDSLNLATLGNKVMILGDLGRIADAIETSLFLVSTSKNIADESTHMFHVLSMALLYGASEEYETAEVYLLKSIDFYRSKNNTQFVALAAHNLGYVTSRMGRLDEAEQYFRESLRIYEKNDFQCRRYAPYDGLAVVYREKGQLDSAKYYSLKSIEACEICGDKEIQSSAWLNLGRSYKDEKNFTEAEKAFVNSYELASEVTNRNILMESAEELFLFYKNQGNTGKALLYHEAYKANADSIFNQNQMAEIARLESDFKHREEQKLLLEKQKNKELLLETEIAERQSVVYLISGGMAVLLIILVAIIVIFRRTKIKNKVIASQNIKLARSAQKVSELSSFKEGLTHMIAHDMKNALNTILGYAASDPYNKKMHNISQSGHLILNLVTNMLDVQRFEETKVPLNLQKYRVKELCDEAKSQVVLLLQMKSLTYKSEIDADHMVLVDQEVFVRVLVNLLTNAIKYSDPGSTINLKIEATEGKVAISITDEGVGISIEKLPYVFDKFWQYDAKSSGNAASTGLGLAFCKLAVEAHNGKITVHSEVGKGSTFTLFLNGVIEEQKQPTPLNEAPVIVNVDTLTSDDCNMLAPYYDHLNDLEVFQVGELNKLFQKMESEGVQGKWFEAIKASVYYADEEMYNSLKSQLQVLI